MRWMPLLLLLCLLVVPCYAINIDGDFSDWKDIKPASGGLGYISDTGASSEFNSLRIVWATSDSENIYVSVQCASKVIAAQWSPTLLAIDTDCNPSTGFPCGTLGIEYMIQPDNRLDGSIQVHKRKDGENNTTWSLWHPCVSIAKSFAIGTGADSNRVEMRVPFKELGISDPSTAIIRFRVCDGAGCLAQNIGSWAPSLQACHYSIGNDPAGVDRVENACVNGDFENLMQANANPLPQTWMLNQSNKAGAIETSHDSASGNNSLRLMASDGKCTIVANSATMAVGHGVLRFRYKAVQSAVAGRNIRIFVIAMTGVSGTEIERQGWSMPEQHVGDGKWHEGTFEFDFSHKNAKYCLIAPRINENTPETGSADLLLDAMEVYSIVIGSQVKIARVWCDKPVARVGEKIRFSAWMENRGDTEAKGVVAELNLPEGISCAGHNKMATSLSSGSYERLDWDIVAKQAGSFVVKTAAKVDSSTPGIPAAKIDSESCKILVIAKDAKYTRQELCTDGSGDWRILLKPTTLQVANTESVKAIEHKTSAEIKHNTYGICTHLPRAKDYEDPFNPNHLIDDDADSCWSSQQNASTFPGNAPWVEITLAKASEINQVNLIPYWRNTDFPIGFSVSTSIDGKSWDKVLQVKNHRFADAGSKRGDKIAQEFKLSRSVRARRIKVEFDRLPASGGNYAEVSGGYKARLSGIELIDSSGSNIALTSAGANVKACDYFTGWQNTAKTVNETFPKIMEIGLKWVRVGQWGDQTEWAAVERKKGEFQMDPVTDAAITTLANNGVDLLYGLNYGNPHYTDSTEPFGEIGPIYKEGHPFYLSGGPKSEQGRQSFVKYVDWVVRKYSDRVKWWELWNEENGWYPGHDPVNYGKLLYAVAKQVKSIDPTLKVSYGGTAAPAPITTEIALREGAAPYVDAYAFHPYGIDKPEGGIGTMEEFEGKSLGKSREQTGWNHLEEIIEGVKQPFVQHGRPDIAVWMNEWGTNVSGRDFAYNPGVGEYACSKYMMRWYIYSGWLNVPTAWWALYNMNKSQDWGIVEQNGYGLRPMSYGLQNVCSVVSDVQPIKKIDYTYEGAAPDPKVISFKRDGKDETVVLVWGAEGATDDVKTYPSKLRFATERKPSKVTLVDIYWGLSQAANWNHDNGQVVLDQINVHDYPLAIICE